MRNHYRAKPGQFPISALNGALKALHPRQRKSVTVPALHRPHRSITPKRSPPRPHFHRMGRIARVVALGEAHHITHRGIARQPIFHSEQARSTYLQLLREQAARHKLRLLGYCLMTNHVHWLAVPEQPDALARTVRFVHGPYAQYVNTALGRSGHFWQNRFYSCPVENRAIGPVLAYIELNPVRAGLCRQPAEFRWSSAGVHLGMPTQDSLLDLNWWRDFWDAERWAAVLADDHLCAESLRLATYTGRPFGADEFVSDLELTLRRKAGAPPGWPTEE